MEQERILIEQQRDNFSLENQRLSDAIEELRAELTEAKQQRSNQSANCAALRVDLNTAKRNQNEEKRLHFEEKQSIQKQLQEKDLTLQAANQEIQELRQVWIVLNISIAAKTCSFSLFF